MHLLIFICLTSYLIYIVSNINLAYYDLYAGRLEKLKQEVKKLFSSTKGSYDRLKLIDSLQRLGVAYHFEQEIEEAINLLTKDVSTLKDLNETALYFRLLREHGHSISTDVFDKFRNADGKFSESLEGDITGLLSLYEASFLGSVQEDVLEEAKSFSTKHLNDYLSGKLETNFLTEKLQQSLDIPLYWRMQRNEAQNFIDLYPTDDPKNLALLLELAKLDFNLVQSIHQKELKELARWWRELGFKETLSFSRDRLMENYLWAMGIVFEPQFNKCRIELTKFVCILTAIDDMYDIYGSLNELELFTDAVKRWGYWGHANKPTLNEYLEIAWTSVGGRPAAIVHACMQPPKECNLTKHSLINCRKDGYEAEIKRGDVVKFVQCCMNEEGIYISRRSKRLHTRFIKLFVEKAE
ncbi:hypothetical protein CUMW_173270 [Citrus unshiu]|uniref:Uncharacterized protein n=1 Tax=Citrus unshiu TaxID=55188 RepID=A0A2H5PWA4_CITUN|nr:hypothetical protein CUMW_173270 [Citrus unshiu]